jgi:hypothetical protein
MAYLEDAFVLPHRGSQAVKGIESGGRDYRQGILSAHPGLSLTHLPNAPRLWLISVIHRIADADDSSLESV